MRDERAADSPATRPARLSRRRLLRRGLAGLALTGSGLTTAASATAMNTDPAARRSATGARTQTSPQFSQQQKLTAPDDKDGRDFFGATVALSDDGTALVRAPKDGSGLGPAYVFTRSGKGEWTQQQKLSTPEGNRITFVGQAAALSSDGTTALIGAFNDEGPTGDRTGSAYVFTRSDGEWSQQQKLIADDGDDGDFFGATVALSADGRTALIGAPTDEDPNGELGGAVYVFTRSNGEWSQQQKLAADEGNRGRFGDGVALSDSGETALIGASLGASAYVFTNSGGEWTQQQTLTGEGSSFGIRVALSDERTALISAPGSTKNFTGAVVVFTSSDGEWSRQQKLTADDGDVEDAFGAGSVTVSDSGDTAVIGASGDEDPNGKFAGSAYVFTRSDGRWSQQQKLTATDGDENDRFGLSTALSADGTTALIGALGGLNENEENAGSAYVFSGGDQQDPAPGDGGQAPVALALEAPETLQPGETVTVTAELTNRDVPEPSSGAIELTTVPEPLSLSSDSENPVFLGFGNPLPAVGESVTQQFELAAPQNAAVEQDLTLEAEAVVQNDTDERNTTTTQTVTITDQQDPVERFDQNDEPGIQGDEVLDAISEFNEGGDVEATDVLDVISAFNENSG